jgi:hypothetical protein
VPRDAEILVKLGDNVKGGSSVLAKWVSKSKSPEAGREKVSDAEAVLPAVGKRA